MAVCSPGKVTCPDLPLPLPLATVMLLLFCHGPATRDKPAAEPSREVKVMAEETQKPPLSDYYELLDARTYLHTPKRWVALCALKSKFGKEMKPTNGTGAAKRRAGKLPWPT